MNVRDLIKKLQELPESCRLADVYCEYGDKTPFIIGVKILTHDDSGMPLMGGPAVLLESD